MRTIWARKCNPYGGMTLYLPNALLMNGSGLEHELIHFGGIAFRL